VAEYGQNCQDNKPIIDYNKCSNDFTSLYRESAASFNKYARKHAGVVVPARTVLVWPGLSFRHAMGRSVPAWSLGRGSRGVNSTFANWIFNEEEQCQKGDVDNTVCASKGSNVLAVIPWLGGDYNPW
jgi:hypothetical protein